MAIDVVLLVSMCLAGTVWSHSYKINYHNEQQTVHIDRNGEMTDISFGDIVDIGNNRRIVYIGNGRWREKDDPESSRWPSKVHEYTAQDMSSWPQLIKTGFEILDDQLKLNQGYMDAVKAKASAHGEADNVYERVEGGDYFAAQKAMFVVTMVLLCCLGGVCVAGAVCIGCGAYMSHVKRGKYHFEDALSVGQYSELQVHAGVVDE